MKSPSLYLCETFSFENSMFCKVADMKSFYQTSNVVYADRRYASLILIDGVYSR